MSSRLSKVALRTALAMVAVIAVAVVALAVTERTYLTRFLTHPDSGILEVDWYVPKEAVPGGRGAPLPRAGSQRARIAPEALEAAASLAERKNSAALLVLHEGHVVLERYWHGHGPERWTDSASMAKTITSLLIGIAVGEGRIPSLDASASQWIPAWRDDGRRAITIRHLLQMNSGLRPQGAYDDPFSDASYLALGDDMRYVVDTVPLVAEPGTVHDYNNTNFQALGIVLESATGTPYAHYLSQRLWRPLGCADAALWLECEGGSARAFGFLFARAEDWARVGLLMLDEGRWNGRQIVPREHVAAMCTPSPTSPRYGLGLWLAHRPREDREPFLDQATFYLDGRSKQRVYVFPAHDLVVVRVGANAKQWDDAALGNILIRGLR